MIDNISGLRSFELTILPDGNLLVGLEKKYGVNAYVLDLDQAEALGKSLIEMTIGLRADERTGPAPSGQPAGYEPAAGPVSSTAPATFRPDTED